VGQQLERQCRAVDHLPPPPGVARRRQPLPPEGDGGVHQRLRIRRRRILDRPVAFATPARQDVEHEGHHVALVKVEAGAGVPVRVALQGRRRAQHESQVIRREAKAPLGPDVDAVACPPIVEARGETHAQAHRPAHRAHAAHHTLTMVGVVGGQHRHAVEHLHHSGAGEEPGDQDVGLGKIELAGVGLPDPGDRPMPAVGVQQRTENAGGVEAWTAEPVDPTAGAHQRRAAQVADQTVVADRGATLCGEHRRRIGPCPPPPTRVQFPFGAPAVRAAGPPSPSARVTQAVGGIEEHPAGVWAPKGTHGTGECGLAVTVDRS